MNIVATDITGSGFDSLAKLPSLTRIGMQGIKLKHGSLAKLKPIGDQLTGLNLSRTGMNNEDMAAIGDLHGLNNLDISNNNLLGDACSISFRSLTGLKVLDISDTGITEKSLPDLCTLPKLNKLTVRGSRFWTSGKPEKQRGNMKIRDTFIDGKVPLEMFSPLH